MNPLSDKYYVTEYIENNHPSFLLIPFRSEDIFINREINRQGANNVRRLLQQRHPNKHITITSGARRSLALALQQINKKKGVANNVNIKTTSDNFYISGCVTKTIEQTNTWAREAIDTDDIKLVNHEFGFSDNSVLQAKNALLIEDCAFSFNSKLEDGSLCGSKGTYSLYSFSKFFPIQLGGYLVSDEPIENDENPEMLKYVENVVGHYFQNIEEWSAVRLKNHQYYNEVFSELGCTPVFEANDKNIPGVYLFNLPKGVDGQKLKEYYWSRGVQSSVFYGRDAFFLPLNHFTSFSHIDFFADLFYAFER